MTDTTDNTLIITIEDELTEVRKVYNGGYLQMLELEDGTEWYVARDSEQAGEAAAKYWRDMAEGDPKEFACIIGEERLVQWGLGQSDSFGISGVDDFCERNANVPEENFASYDGQEREVTACSESLEDELGFKPTVAYRHN